METMKRFFPFVSTKALRSLGIATVVLIVLGSSSVARASDETTVRWDIISLAPKVGGGFNVSAGGISSALANDGTEITVTGSGTFKIEDGEFENVTGGGDWTIGSASGTYKAKGVVLFIPAPGVPNPANTDLIGDASQASAGLLVLRIKYDDGSKGILVVSCHLVGTPDSVFEGITASKGFVDFWNREAPNSAPPFVDANRNLFHIVPGEGGDDD